jgi:hypothetical protein
MERNNKIAFIQIKLVEGWSDIDIRRAIEVPRSTYFYWKGMPQKGQYAALVRRQKPGPNPHSQWIL